jgi:hypothetical protein
MDKNTANFSTTSSTTLEPLTIQVTCDKIANSTIEARSGGEAEMDSLRVLSVELTNHYYKANALVEAAVMTLPATEPSILAPFVLISVLNGVFLVFPWVLLLLFFLRKRDPLVESKSAHIRELKLANKLLKGSEDKKGPEDAVKEEIKKRTFRISEYLISLSLLTIVSAAMWYFFFYPYASAGLASLISSGGGVRAFADYLANDATPITYGFIGASLFITQMLLRRYFNDDLSPRPYAFAVVRILTVFILSAILQLVAVVEGSALFVVSILAFVVGIFPDVGIQYILKFVNKTVPDASAPESVNKAPITKVEGIDIWHEARLKEESIENMQNLATASLANLIVNTNYCPAQLVDWVDQALLCVHTHGIWDESLHSVGIRTATDLFDNTYQDREFNTAKAERLVAAINAARTLTPPDNGKPRDAAMIAGTALYKAADENVAAVKEAEKLTSALDSANLDVIKDLQQKMTELLDAAKSQNAEEANKIAQKIPTSGGDPVKQIQKVAADLEKAAKKLPDSVTKAKDLSANYDRKKPETLVKLEDFKTALNTVSSDADDFLKQLASVVKLAEPKATDPATKKDWEPLLDALKKLEEATKPLENVSTIQEMAKSVDKDKPETMNRILELQKKMEKAQKAAEDLQAKMEKAQKTFEDLPGPQALLAETRKSLTSTRQTVDTYVKDAGDAKDKAAALDIENQSSMSALPDVKEKTKKLKEAADETKTEAQKTAIALQTAASPPAVTKEILESLTKSIENGPNIKTITDFWESNSKSV